jgi:hypothetical protein
LRHGVRAGAAHFQKACRAVGSHARQDDPEGVLAARAGNGREQDVRARSYVVHRGAIVEMDFEPFPALQDLQMPAGTSDDGAPGDDWAYLPRGVDVIVRCEAMMSCGTLIHLECRWD